MVTFASVVLLASLSAGSACHPLHEAAKANDVPRIRQLLAGRLLGLAPSSDAADLDRAGDFGECESRTPLMVAAEAGSLQAALELLRRGADARLVLEDRELGPMSAWCYALLSARGEPVAAALESESSRRKYKPEGVCVDNARLIAAVREGTVEEVRFQLRASPSQQALAYALNESVGQRQLDPVRGELLARLVDRHNLKAVQTAVWKADTLALTQLAEGGATVSNDRALTNLWTERYEHTTAEILTQLLQMTTLTTGQVSALSWEALNHDHLETLEALGPSRVLLRPDPPAGARDELSVWASSDGEALSLALKSSDPARAVRALLRLGVELDTPEAMSKVAAGGNCAVAKVLYDAGARLNQVDQRCQTPLEVARAHQQWGLVRALAPVVKGHPRLVNPNAWCADTAADDPKPWDWFSCSED